MNGVCSPACDVRYQQTEAELISRLGEFAIDSFGPTQTAGYPTICKGRYEVRGERLYLFEEPTSLSAFSILPRLAAAGVTAIKIEGRQRGKAYVMQVVSSFRRALDAMSSRRPLPDNTLHTLAEGGHETTGAYGRRWR